MKLNADIVEGFVGSLLSKGFDESVARPACHREWWELCTGGNKYVAIAAPRGHAKSTAITFSYGLAAALFRERKFIIIVSDTETQANMFLGAWKQELQDNQDLIELFGLKKNEKGQVAFEKDSESDIIVEFNDGYKFRVIAKGSEQKLRGLLWNGSRPDLIIGDDLENDEIVLNKERREKFRRWFLGALLPCLSASGVIRLVGTILHMDSLLERFMPVESDRHTISDGLKTISTRRSLWKSVKYQAHDKDFEHILWPQRWPAEKLKALKEDYTRQGLGDVYSQEMLNIPLDESNSYFKKADFLPAREDDHKKKLNYYITADLAISLKEKADYSVFVIAGVDEDRRIIVKDVIRDRLDGREIVDTLIALQRSYQPEAVGIEEGQISKSIGPFLNEAMIGNNTFLNLYPLKHMSLDKPTRARSIQARMRAKTIKFDKEKDWYQSFEDELMRFPRDKHDDQVDSFAYLGLMLDKLLEAPTVQEQQEEEYQDELRTSNLLESGRSSITGY